MRSNKIIQSGPLEANIDFEQRIERKIFMFSSVSCTFCKKMDTYFKEDNTE